jgi:hypothetical protein
MTRRNSSSDSTAHKDDKSIFLEMPGLIESCEASVLRKEDSILLRQAGTGIYCNHSLGPESFGSCILLATVAILLFICKLPARSLPSWRDYHVLYPPVAVSVAFS